MAVSRLFDTGFEWGDLALEFDEIKSIGGFETVDNVTKKTGNYSLRINGNYGNSYVTKILPPNPSYYTQLRASFYFNRAITMALNDVIFFSFGNPIVTNVLGVGFNSPVGGLSVFYGDSYDIYDTAHSPILSGTEETFVHMTFDVKLHETDGWAYVYINGDPLVTYEGKTTDGSFVFDRVHIGTVGVNPYDAALNSYNYYDDVYVDDTLGETSPSAGLERRFLLVVPNDDGDLIEWVGSDSDSDDNYQLVDDVPPDDDTTYVTVDEPNKTDRYEMPSPTLPSGFDIAAVTPMAVAKKVDSSSPIKLRLGTRLSTSESLSSARALGTDFSLIVGDRQETKPTSGAWSASDVDDSEIVITTSF